jgi:hypothetical protein
MLCNVTAYSLLIGLRIQSAGMMMWQGVMEASSYNPVSWNDRMEAAITIPIVVERCGGDLLLQSSTLE